MRNPQLSERIAASFSRQALMATLGARLVSVADGCVEIELPRGEPILQQHGFVRAGAVASIADSACGYACLTRMPGSSAVLSVEFKINLLAPATGVRLLARGVALRVGRTIGVATAEVHGFDATGAGTLVAVMQATMMRVDPRDGRDG